MVGAVLPVMELTSHTGVSLVVRRRLSNPPQPTDLELFRCAAGPGNKKPFARETKLSLHFLIRY